MQSYAALVILSLTAGQVLAQAPTPPDDAVVYSNEFLSVGVGARAQALGNSTVASSSDIFSTYWNPAGLAAVDTTDGLMAGAMHAEQFTGVTKFDYLGVSVPVAGGGRRLGLSLIRQGTDDIPNTLNLLEPDGSVNYDNITYFAVADYAFVLSYAQPTRLLGGRLAVGGNLKVIRRVLGDFSKAWGVGVDVAARYDAGALRAGLVMRDVTTTYNSWKTTFSEADLAVLQQTGNTLPDASGTEITRPSLLPSVAYRFGLGRSIGVAPEATLVVTFDGRRNTLIASDAVSADLAAGIEVDFRKIVYARFGMDQFQSEQPFGASEASLSPRLAVGLGLQIKRFHLDYAFSNPGDADRLYAHVVSLHFALPRG